MEKVQGQLSALSPSHTMFFRTQMQPTSLRSLIPCTPTLDMSLTSGPGKVSPLSRCGGRAGRAALWGAEGRDRKSVV